MNFGKIRIEVIVTLNLLSFVFLEKANAQYSLSSTYSQLSFENLDEQADLIQFEVGYWFRFKKSRVEFYPSILYNRFDYLLEEMGDVENLGFTLPINVYPYDFRNDCDCPLRSKNGEWIKKGFFVQLKPTVEYELEQEKIAISTGLFLGLDFGISDLLTISPAAGYQYYLNDNSSWDRQGGLSGQLRLLFRPDYTRSR